MHHQLPCRKTCAKVASKLSLALTLLLLCNYASAQLYLKDYAKQTNAVKRTNNLSSAPPRAFQPRITNQTDLNAEAKRRDFLSGKEAAQKTISQRTNVKAKSVTINKEQVIQTDKHSARWRKN